VSRRALLLLALVAASCRRPAQIEVTLSLMCGPNQGPPAPPSSCDQMTLGCADFIEFYVYQADGDRPGNLLGSNCLSAAQLGAPADFCALRDVPSASLIPSLQEGQTVIFGMRAIHAFDRSAGCNDFLAKQQPVKLFYGLSSPFTVDGSDHQVTIVVDQCGSCGALPQSMTPMCLGPGTTMPNYDTTRYPGGASCCPISLACAYQPGAPCPDGTHAQLLPGGCCGSCPTQTAPAATGATPPRG
jgi:hypothetical protein